MNRLVWKLLRRHISIGQLSGFFLANLFGMLIILLGTQFYHDVLPALSGKESFMQKEYVIATKRISTLGGLTGKSNTFTAREMEEMADQPFAGSVGGFTPALFNVSASVGIKEMGVHLSTAMFFEAVPDEFIDVELQKWEYDESSRTIPIIIPRNYLNLYNFGFAQSRGLPKLSDGLVSMIQMDIRLSGNGTVQHYKGNIVGFSNRLNTILIPQSFMERANRHFAPGKTAHPSRLIVEVENPADSSISDYFTEKRYETEGNSLDAGRAGQFLRILANIVIGVGCVICLLSLYILMLSIFLLIQKNSQKLENLLLMGYSTRQVALPYHLLTVGLNLLVWLLATLAVMGLRHYYTGLFDMFLLSPADEGSLLPCLSTGGALFLLVSLLNIGVISRKIKAIGGQKKKA
ncbi:MAG: ABC transporter permease [Bacteroides sp.]|nr:ABC transporter permease [Bacteroides sp.]